MPLNSVTQTCFISEPNKEKTEPHHNGDLSSATTNVVAHSPKSCGLLSPGSVPLPGLVTHRENGVSVTVSNGASSHYQARTVFSPESEHSPPTPGPPQPPQRPASLNNVKGQTAGKSGGKRTRWLLCYHMGGGPPSASPSPPSEAAGHSQCSTPSPTDHGFKLPNSFSNERPTSLPVALLNCSGPANTDSLSSVVGRGLGGESNITAPAWFSQILFISNLFYTSLVYLHPLLPSENFSREGFTKILLNCTFCPSY